jgi:hypothetical protein
VEAHGDVVGVGLGQRGVDDLRVRAPVLVDLQPARAGLDHPLDLPRHVRPRARLEPEVHREVLEGPVGLVHRERRLLEARGDEGGDADRERHGHEPGREEVHVAVDGAGGRDQPVGVHRPRVRADHELHAVGDVRAPGPTDADDPSVLDPDVRLQHPEDRVDQHDARDQHVELALGGGPVELGHP